MYINPLLPGILFSYSLKTLANHRFSDVFRGHKKGTSSSSGLNNKRPKTEPCSTLTRTNKEMPPTAKR